MISSVLTLLLAATAVQTDTTRTAREAYTRCLRAFVEQSVRDRMAADAFNTAYAQQCTGQERALRTAVIARETSTRATRATAEESASMEVDDAKANFRELFDMSQPAPVAQAAASAEAPATPAAAPATPAAQPAAATTTPQ